MVAVTLASAACLLLTLACLAAGQPASQAASPAAQASLTVRSKTLRVACNALQPSAAVSPPLPLARCPASPHICHHPLQPGNDIDSFVRVVDGQFVVVPSCKRFLVTGWNQ